MNYLLLIFSTIIYASFGVSNLFFILFSTFTSFFAAKYFNKKNKKILFTLCITINILILIFFKLILFNHFFGVFSGKNILVPLGISYYTFQILSYLIDVYQNKYVAEENILHYLLFVLYIPYLFIGPINRYDKIKETLFAKRSFSKDRLWNGLLRILWGLFKKLVIAARIGIIISAITGNQQVYRGTYVLFAVLLYSIQLYSDFSGGIDIVIGFSNILGISLQENFDRPYFSETVKDFWRKWHISLSNWLKDYIYIPLGGNKCSNIRQKCNVLITFIISGLWHGIHYILWGLCHGLFVAFQKKKISKHKIVNQVITFLIVSVLWVFFVYPSTLDAIKMFITIFTSWNFITVFQNMGNLGLDFINAIVLIISMIILWIYDFKKDTICHKIHAMKTENKLLLVCFMILVILVFGIYGYGFNVNDFIYSKF